MPSFSPERSEVIRANLIDQVSRDLRPRRRRALWTVGFVLLGTLVGAGASAGAFAATGLLDTTPARPTGEPQPTYPDAVAAPPGVTPGAPIVSLLGDSVVQPIEAATEVSLEDRPVAATHARVTITALSPGSLSWGTDPGGNNPSGGWSAQDLARTSGADATYDLPLDGTVHALYLNPSAFTGIATIQYVAYVPTLLGVNANGQTYGASGSLQGEPDLVWVEGTAPDGSVVNGYVFSTQLGGTSPDHEGLPSSPEEALRWQAETAEKYPNGWTVPVYAADGTTQIGVFTIGG